MHSVAKEHDISAVNQWMFYSRGNEHTCILTWVERKESLASFIICRNLSKTDNDCGSCTLCCCECFLNCINEGPCPRHLTILGRWPPTIGTTGEAPFVTLSAKSSLILP